MSPSCTRCGNDADVRAIYEQVDDRAEGDEDRDLEFENEFCVACYCEKFVARGNPPKYRVDIKRSEML